MFLNGPVEWKATCQHANEAELYVLDTLAKILYLESFSFRIDQRVVRPTPEAALLYVCSISISVTCLTSPDFVVLL